MTLDRIADTKMIRRLDHMTATVSNTILRKLLYVSTMRDDVSALVLHLEKT